MEVSGSESCPQSSPNPASGTGCVVTIVNETFWLKTTGLYKWGFVCLFFGVGGGISFHFFLVKHILKMQKFLVYLNFFFFFFNQPQQPEEDIHMEGVTALRRISKRLTVRGARVSFHRLSS